MKKRISNISIRFVHNELENLSDNTLRKLLKEYSKLTRELLIEELDNILIELELPFRQRQSLKTIIKNESLDKPNYYVEKIEKGSLIVIGILAGTTIFLLKQTLGKSFDRAWKNSEPGKDTDELLLKGFNKLYSYLKERPDRIKKLLEKLKGKILGDRYRIKSVKELTNKSESIFEIEILTLKDANEIEGNKTIDAEYIEYEIIEEIKNIENRMKNDNAS